MYKWAFLGGSYKSASIAATNDYFGDKFGMLRQPIRLAAAAAAIEKGAIKKYFVLLFYCGFFYCDDRFKPNLSIAVLSRLLWRRNRKEAPQLERFYTSPILGGHFFCGLRPLQWPIKPPPKNAPLKTPFRKRFWNNAPKNAPRFESNFSSKF